MVMLNPGEHGEGQIHRHAASHLPKGQDPVFVTGNADPAPGDVFVYINGTWTTDTIQNVINNYTTNIGLGTVYIPFGSEAVTGQAYAP